MYTLGSVLILLAAVLGVVWLALLGNWVFLLPGLVGLWVLWAWRQEVDRRVIIARMSDGAKRRCGHMGYRGYDLRQAGEID